MIITCFRCQGETYLSLEAEAYLRLHLLSLDTTPEDSDFICEACQSQVSFNTIEVQALQ